MSSELTDAELDAIERECAVLIRYDGPGGTSSDVLRLVAALRVTRARLAAAEELLHRWVTPEKDMTCQDRDWLGLHLHDETEDFLAHPEPEEAP